MVSRRYILWMTVALIALAAGCERVTAYEPIKDLTSAQDAAGLIVVGDVGKIETVRHYTGHDIVTAGFGKLGTECVAEEKVSLKVGKVVKGPKDILSPLDFFYNCPCFHPEKGVKVQLALPTLSTGDKLVAYLEMRDGRWWLISHKLENPTAAALEPNADSEERWKLYAGDY
jgi:hypothetical protein